MQLIIRDLIYRSPLKNVAVGEFRFEQPLQIWDKPLFFVTVEGFGDDPSESDIVMLTEVMGQDIPEEQMTSMLAHNSFVNYNDMGYNMPVNYFGAAPGASFMICPIVDNKDGDATDITPGLVSGSETRLQVSSLNLTIGNDDATSVSVVNAAGMKVCERNMVKGQDVSLTLPGAGLYLVQVFRDGKQIDIKKVLVNLKSASNLNGNLNCSKELEHYAS